VTVGRLSEMPCLVADKKNGRLRTVRAGVFSWAILSVTGRTAFLYRWGRCGVAADKDGTGVGDARILGRT